MDTPSIIARDDTAGPGAAKSGWRGELLQVKSLLSTPPVLRVPPDNYSGTGSKRNVADLRHFQAHKNKNGA